MGVTPQQFEQMRKRVSGAKAAPKEVEFTRRPLRHEVVLGIDPSLRGTGYGVIRLDKPGVRAVIFDTISCPKTWPRSRCLAKIVETLRRVLVEHRPTTCIIEGLFFAQNLQTALIMGEARGACLAVVAEAGLPIYEIAPRKVKQAIVGYGAAQKIAVAKMVQRMLNLAELPAADAADALALALCHVQDSKGSAPPKRI